MAEASQTGTDKHQSDHTSDVLSFWGVLRQPQHSFHPPKHLEFRIYPDLSANTPGKEFRGIPPSPWGGSRSPVDVTVTGERLSTALGGTSSAASEQLLLPPGSDFKGRS